MARKSKKWKAKRKYTKRKVATDPKLILGSITDIEHERASINTPKIDMNQREPTAYELARNQLETQKRYVDSLFKERDMIVDKHDVVVRQLRQINVDIDNAKDQLTEATANYLRTMS